MYLIEIICEYSFNDENLLKYSGELSAIFSKFMEDSDIKVIFNYNIKKKETFLFNIR